MDKEKLALQLLVGGKIVRGATGPNDKAGGSEALAAELWDVAEFASKRAVLRIVDDAKGGSAKFESLQVHELKSAWTSR